MEAARENRSTQMLGWQKKKPFIDCVAIHHQLMDLVEGAEESDEDGKTA